MTRHSLIALVLGALLTFPAQAQDPQKPAAQEPAAAPGPVPGDPLDQKIIVGLMECLGEGLPEGWKKTWFVIREIRRGADGVRQYEAKFFYSMNPADRVGRPLEPCGATRIIDGVLAMNAYLQPSQRRWTGMTMTFNIDSSFEATYDFNEPTPAAGAAPAKAAPRPAAKKKQEAAK